MPMAQYETRGALVNLLRRYHFSLPPELAGSKQPTMYESGLMCVSNEQGERCNLVTAARRK